MSDLLFDDDFGDSEDTGAVVTKQAEFWNVLIVDDDEEVHQVTKLALSNFKFDDKRLKFTSAYSGDEAINIFKNQSDIAMVLLDVVMESPSAGLEVVDYVRNKLKNHFTRIVLRTGQPGQAPEDSVIRDFDINDYKDKSELTTIKLTTLMFSALRSYKAIQKINSHRLGLERVIGASTQVFETADIKSFASAVLGQITNILNLDDNAVYCSSIKKTHTPEDAGNSDYEVLAASGGMDYLIASKENDAIPVRVRKLMDKAYQERTTIIENGAYVGYFETAKGAANLLFVSFKEELSDLARQLLDIYASNVAITYETLLIRNEILDTQKELIYLLSESVEKLSKETGFHVKRVAEMSAHLAELAGADEKFCEMIKYASPLHDIGKVLIPDEVLNKPGKHDADEWKIMQSHAALGADILSDSQKSLLKMGSTIASQHHEKWNGKGYPKGLKGEEIALEGRIVALVDVYDALGARRCYKEPWPKDKIIALMKEEAGEHFDPKLVQLMLDNIEDFEKLSEQFADGS